MATQKKYVSLSKLSTFLDNLKTTFASLGHKHTINDLTDYTVDTSLSSTSTNPVQNKVVNTAIVALNTVAAGKADSNHTHDSRYYTESEIDSKLSSKADVDHEHTHITNGDGTVEIVDVLLGDAVQSGVVQFALAPSINNGTSLAGPSAGNYNGASLGTENNPWCKLYMSTVEGQAGDIYVDGNRYSVTDDLVNQNAFSKVTVGSTTIEADSTTDTLTLVAGSNITLTPYTSGDKITIAATDTVYTHPNSGVTAGTYKSVTVNAKGHVTGGTNPTTLAGYGITDAESKGAANTALSSAKSYADSGDATTLSSAKTYADSAATTAANNVKNDLLNGAGAAYDTLKELGDLIDDNTDAIDALEIAASNKMDKVNPTGSGNVSFGRATGSTVGDNSVVIGTSSKATASNSIAIGSSTTASGANSTVIGCGSTASGEKSTALGDHNTASGEYATAMGCWTNAPGTAATSLGNGTTANGWGAMASGIVTNAKGLGQHVFGSYNIPDSNTISEYYDSSEHLIIVGNGDILGDNGVQSNAHTLDWSGNAWFAGDVYVGSTSGTNKDSGSKKLATESYVDTTLDAINENVAAKTAVQFITWGADD